MMGRGTSSGEAPKLYARDLRKKQGKRHFRRCGDGIQNVAVVFRGKNGDPVPFACLQIQVIQSRGGGENGFQICGTSQNLLVQLDFQRGNVSVEFVNVSQKAFTGFGNADKLQHFSVFFVKLCGGDPVCQIENSVFHVELLFLHWLY